MAPLRQTDVLLAVAEASSTGSADGWAVAAALATTDDARAGADRVLARLLGLEAGGFVQVERIGTMRFGLTSAGERAVSTIVGGRVAATALLMVDLVGFVAFTDRHGDAEAHRSSRALVSIAGEALAEVGGRVVKATGDGLIGAAAPAADLIEVVRTIASWIRLPDGPRWPIRASVLVGYPIEHNGDLFGRDVNLLARLCDAAAPGELVQRPTTCDRAGPAMEELAVRGLDATVRVRREVLP